MRHFRFSIAGLMGVVLMSAVGLAALRNPTRPWAGAMVLSTYGMLGLAILCAVVRGRARRAWWLGFCIFGWGYLSLEGVRAWQDTIELPTRVLIHAIGPWLGNPSTGPFIDFPDELNPWYAQIGHCLLTLLAALLGGFLAGGFLAVPKDCPGGGSTGSRPSGPPPRTWWHGLMVAVLAGLVLAGSFGTIRSRTAPGLWAGATFLLACGLLGLTCLGAILGRERRRPACLGATLFGAGYMLLVFARNPYPTLPTGEFLNLLRPWFPPIAIDAGPGNARVFAMLDRTIPMHFPEETSLDEVLSYIKQATATPTDHGLSMYADPIDLQECERSLSYTVTIDAEGVPLRTTLRLCLWQVDLDYRVRDGYVSITGVDQAGSDPEDPFVIVGHCWLALLAAGFGTVAALLISREDRIARSG
jgi:hypothetical protein